jgi:hypothetical protein
MTDLHLSCKHREYSGAAAGWCRLELGKVNSDDFFRFLIKKNVCEGKTNERKRNGKAWERERKRERDGRQSSSWCRGKISLQHHISGHIQRYASKAFFNVEVSEWEKNIGNKNETRRSLIFFFILFLFDMYAWNFSPLSLALYVVCWRLLQRKKERSSESMMRYKSHFAWMYLVDAYFWSQQQKFHLKAQPPSGVSERERKKLSRL